MRTDWLAIFLIGFVVTAAFALSLAVGFLAGRVW